MRENANANAEFYVPVNKSPPSWLTEVTPILQDLKRRNIAQDPVAAFTTKVRLTVVGLLALLSHCTIGIISKNASLALAVGAYSLLYTWKLICGIIAFLP